MRIPNCVPEFYREQEEKENEDYCEEEREYLEFEAYKEVGEYKGCTLCDGCTHSKSRCTDDDFDPIRYYCSIIECVRLKNGIIMNSYLLKLLQDNKDIFMNALSTDDIKLKIAFKQNIIESKRAKFICEKAYKYLMTSLSKERGK